MTNEKTKYKLNKKNKNTLTRLSTFASKYTAELLSVEPEHYLALARAYMDLLEYYEEKEGWEDDGQGKLFGANVSATDDSQRDHPLLSGKNIPSY